MGCPGPDRISACQLRETSQGLGVFLWPYRLLGCRMKQGESWAELGPVLLCWGPQGWGTGQWQEVGESTPSKEKKEGKVGRGEGGQRP